MTIEEKLKDLICMRFNNPREFSIYIDMPYSTLDSIFRRGINNSSVANIIKICKALNISADALADGEIVSIKNKLIPINERFEIKDILEDTADRLIHSGEITLDGKPISKAGIESILDAIDVGVEIARKKS